MDETNSHSDHPDDQIKIEESQPVEEEERMQNMSNTGATAESEDTHNEDNNNNDNDGDDAEAGAETEIKQPSDDEHEADIRDSAPAPEAETENQNTNTNYEDEESNNKTTNADAAKQEEEEEEMENEEQGEEKDIDEDLFKLKRHKKTSSSGEKSTPSSAKPTQKVRPRKKHTDIALGQEAGRKRSHSDSGLENGEDGQEDGDVFEENQEPVDSDLDDPNMDEATRRRKLLKKRIQEHGAKPKKKSRKADDESLDAFQDELINRLREEMRKAAIADAECIKNSQPAINKLKMLPRVTSVLRKGTLADTILDNNLLESIRIWLEPLPDASLPAYQIQKELFEALETLPIKTIHLRESGLGRVVLFYKQSIRPQLNIKRIVDRLMGNWTRPIMGRSDNYRDKIIRTSNYNVQDDSAYRRRGAAAAALAAAAGAGGSSSQDGGSTNNDLAAASAIRRNRAFIPTAKPVYYEVAPKSVISNAAAGQTKAVNESYKRMTNRLLGKKKPSARKSHVSLEGR